MLKTIIHHIPRHLLLALLLAVPAVARSQSKYRLEVPAPPAKLINGVAVGVDGVGFGMKLASARFANMEVIGRLNMLEKYFPIVELGVGECKREGEEMNTTFSTRAPYFRVGADYCSTKKRNGNRLLFGLRYGFSRFNYDYSNPDFHDPIWNNGIVGSEVKDIKASMHWAEACVGVETKLWQYIRMGWNIRYKTRIKQSDCPHGDPWFVPGYGKNGTTTFGGSVNLIFELQPRKAITFSNKKNLEKYIQDMNNKKK